jgi:hypothetical protein
MHAEEEDMFGGGNLPFPLGKQLARPVFCRRSLGDRMPAIKACRKQLAL